MPLCLCADIERIATRTRVLVVMHRHETFKTSGTARLALKMLVSSSHAVRGEPFVVPEGRRLLLYPTPHARLLTREDAADDVILVVPDGSWAQARRIAQRDPACRDAEAVMLPEASSRYGLRRKPRDGTLCTLEAIAHALAILEGDAVKDTMLDALDRFVERMRFLRGQRLSSDRERLTPLSAEKVSSNDA